jgi:electron transfer flavoprotein alpha subunit
MDAAIAPEICGHADGTFTRPMVAGNLFATVQLAGDKKVVTVRTTAFDAAPAGGASPIEALSVSVAAPANATRFVSVEETKSDRPVLTEASRVVAGGRGLVGGGQTVLSRSSRDGRRDGPGRAAVDSAVPTTCRSVRPVSRRDLYIAVGSEPLALGRARIPR